MKTAIVTGAGGFIGRHLTAHLLRRGWQVKVISGGPAPAGAHKVAVTLDDPESALAAALAGANAVFHLAGIAHERVAGSGGGELHRVNAELPRRVLAAADQAGVGGLVALSSIKVLGDISHRPLRPDDPYRPEDAYAASKVAGEQNLMQFAAAGTRVAIVRPPLVYGPGVGGNFLTLLRWADRAMPLPLAGAGAPRSMVAVDQLCELLVRLGERGSGIFHVADAVDRTVAELFGRLAALLGRPDRSWRLPSGAVRAVAAALGQSGRYTRLFEPLQVDQSGTMQQLCWHPADGEAQLEATVSWYRQLP